MRVVSNPDKHMKNKNEVKKVLMFLGQGFEDLEAVTIIDVLGWTKVRENLVPLDLQTCAFHDEVVGKFGIRIQVDFNIRKQTLKLDEFSAFVLPGGFHDAGFEEAYSEEIHEIASAVYKNQGIITTMCVGILPISDAGLLVNKKATTYNLSRFHNNVSRLKAGKAIYTGKKLEMNSNIISSAGPAASLRVAYILIEKLTGKANANKVKELMIY
jgi:4-methyl-5(b-hydroxyethyl)-thiazole monophosphate biosynthesis